jgi:ankyrin repeat protein
MSALMLAAQRGHAKIAALLLQAGSNVNKQTVL